MPSAPAKDAAIWNIVTLCIGSFVGGMILMLALSFYLRNDPTFLYLYLFLLFPLFIFSSIVTARRILKAIP